MALSFITQRKVLFNAENDTEALLELAHVFGSEEIARTGVQHGGSNFSEDGSWIEDTDKMQELTSISAFHRCQGRGPRGGTSFTHSAM